MRTRRGWALGATVVLLVVLRWVRSTRDPDTFWHIAVGRFIVAHRYVPHHDVFSWYAVGKNLNWIAEEWLFGVVAYALHQAGGFIALNAAACLGLAATFGVLYALIRDRTHSFTAALLLSFFCAYNLTPYTTFRPQFLTYLLVAATLLLAQRQKWYWALGVMLLGVNLHGGVWPVYFVILAVSSWGRDWKVIPLALLVPAVGPYGLEMLAYPFRTLQFDMRGLQEWAAPTLSYKLNPLFLLTFALIVVLTDFKRISLRDGILAGAFTVLGLSANRHTPFWFIVVIPILAPYMCERAAALVRWAAARLSTTPLRGFASLSTEEFLGLWVWVCVLASIGLGLLYMPALAREGWAKDSVPYPSARVVDYVAKHDGPGFYNDYNIGGYLIYRGVAPFIDSRTDLYSAIDNPGETAFADMRDVLASTTLEGFLTKYRLSLLLVTRNTPVELAMRDNDRYVAVLADGDFVVYRVAQ